MEIVWPALAALIFLWALIFADAPVIGWLYAALMALFCGAFRIFYSPARHAEAKHRRLGFAEVIGEASLPLLRS
jgi:hypothetical protein